MQAYIHFQNSDNQRKSLLSNPQTAPVIANDNTTTLFHKDIIAADNCANYQSIEPKNFNFP